jgi:methylenetetrahydrofolate dehydrogenase (NADP+)/methenyltetrahydrofolate cyclohydrolase
METGSLSHKIIDGVALAAQVKNQVRARVRDLGEIGWPSKLVSIEVGGTSATALYVRNQHRACQEVGIAFENRSYSAETTEIEMIAALQALNVDPRVTGIIIQRPLPDHIDLDRLQNSIQGDKDVEGMNAANIGNIVYGRTALGPCTAQASVALLKSTGLDLRGNLHTQPRRADALFVAVGKPGLITADMVMPGAAVIDIGINQIDGGGSRPRVVGDVDFDSVQRVAGWITPVPGGVGPMTVAMLLKNMVEAIERQKRRYEAAMRSQPLL